MLEGISHVYLTHQKLIAAFLRIVHPTRRAMWPALWHQYSVTIQPEPFCSLMSPSLQSLCQFQRSCVTDTSVAAIVVKGEPRRVGAPSSTHITPASSQADPCHADDYGLHCNSSIETSNVNSIQKCSFSNI